MRYRTCCIAVALSCAVASAAATSDRIAAEITRLDAGVAAVVPESSQAPLMSRLDRARKALAAGHIYLALYDLQPVFEAEGGYRIAAMEKSVPDEAAFTRKWKEMGAPPHPPPASAPVLFIEALAQAAAVRAPATYRASRPYAQDAGIMAGLYYLGESHAMIRFAALCRALEARPSGRAPAFGSIEPALAAYEKDVVKAYDAASAAERPQYAAVNVGIKIARTLDEQGRHEGALLQYLVSRLRYASIGRNGAAPSVESLQARVSGTRMPSGVDHSIGEFLLQLASATLEGPGASGGPAAAILDEVLPAYFAVVKP